MAVFTAAATAILGAIGVAGTIAGSAMLFNLAVGVIATGLAMGTAKLLGVYEAPDMGPDPGTKIQLAPATDNKVAKLYGKNFASGPIIDAEIKNGNDTMTYCIVLSEYSDGETWSVNDVFRGDAKLNFSGANVIGQTDPNATSTTDIANKIRVRVYAGGSSASHQVFPATGAVNAYGGTTTSKTGQMHRWNANNTMDGLVFALVELDYDPENQLTGLGAMTFDLENSVHEPGDVLTDYLTNDRYGCGFTTDDFDVDSINDWNDYCTTQQAYHSTLGNVQLQHDKFRIDGALSTFDDCKTNINKICQNAGAFFAYNNKTGKFYVVPLRAATNNEITTAYHFTDNNIVSSLSFTSSELFSQFNAVEVEYASYNQKDQTDVYYSEIDPSLRHPNEPDNVMKFRLDMCNDRTRVAQLANIDINQNRLNQVVEFTGDHSTLVVDVGDVVKLSNSLYGYDEKLYRVMRVTEQEDNEGVLTCKFTLLEYDSDVYADLLTGDDLPKGPTGINNYYASYSASTLDIGQISVANVLENQNVATFDINGNSTGTDNRINIVNRVFPSGADSNKPFIALELQPQDDGISYTNYRITMVPYDASNNVLEGTVVYDVYPSLGTRFTRDGFRNICVPITGTGPNPNVPESAERVELFIRGVEEDTGAKSQILTVGLIPVEPIIPVVIEANTISITEIPDGSITTNLIAPNAVTTVNVADDAITTNTIAPNAVSTVNIADDAVTTDTIAPNAVTTVNIEDNAVTTETIAANAVTNDAIATDAVTSDSIATDAVTNEQIANNAVTNESIATDAVTNDAIANNAVTSDSIATDAVTNEQIANNAVTNESIATDAVTSDSIATDAVTNEQIANNAVTNESIATDAVTSDSIATDAVTNEQIAVDAVTNESIANSAVTIDSMERIGAGVQYTGNPPDKLDLPAGTTGQLLAPVFVFSVVGADPGVYPMTFSASLVGQIPASGVHESSIGHLARVVYIQDQTGSLHVGEYYGGGTQTTSGVIIDLSIAHELIVDPASEGLDSTWKPYYIQYELQGRTTLDANTFGQRGFSDMLYNISKITKGTLA